jgi:hypothetical protein
MNWDYQVKNGFLHFVTDAKLEIETVEELKKLLPTSSDAIVELKSPSPEVVEELVSLIDQQTNRNQSLIFVVSESEMGVFGDREISMAPTLLEAQDLLEMIRIERELGF